MEQGIDFLKEYYWWVILIVAVFVGQWVQKWRYNHLSQNEENFTGNYSVIFAPVDLIEKNGPIDQQFGFGPRISRIGSQKIFLALQVIFFFGVVFLALRYLPLENLVGDQEKMISFGIIGAYGLYVLYRMTKQIDLHEGGLILRSLFGSSGYSYESIYNLNFTHKINRVRGDVVWWIWKIPVVILELHSGEAIELSSTTYSSLRKKMKELDQNLVNSEENNNLFVKEEEK